MLEKLEEIRDLIKHIYVQMPDSQDLTVAEMQGWMNGYGVCHQEVLKILDKAIKEAKKMSKYKYKGPVTSFGRVIAWDWKGETIAESTAKAKSNLAFQFKKANNLVSGSRIELPGKIMVSSI